MKSSKHDVKSTKPHPKSAKPINLPDIYNTQEAAKNTGLVSNRIKHVKSDTRLSNLDYRRRKLSRSVDNLDSAIVSLSCDLHGISVANKHDERFDSLMNKRQNVLFHDSLYGGNASLRESRVEPCDMCVDKDVKRCKSQHSNINGGGRRMSRSIESLDSKILTASLDLRRSPVGEKNNDNERFDSLRNRKRSMSFSDVSYDEGASLRESTELLRLRIDQEVKTYGPQFSNLSRRMSISVDNLDSRIQSASVDLRKKPIGYENDENFDSLRNRRSTPVNDSLYGENTMSRWETQDTNSDRNREKIFLPPLNAGKANIVKKRDSCYLFTNPKAIIEKAILKKAGFCPTNLGLKKKKRPPAVIRQQGQINNEVTLEDPPLIVNIPASSEFKKTFYKDSDIPSNKLRQSSMP